MSSQTKPVNWTAVIEENAALFVRFANGELPLRRLAVKMPAGSVAKKELYRSESIHGSDVSRKLARTALRRRSKMSHLVK